LASEEVTSWRWGCSGGRSEREISTASRSRSSASVEVGGELLDRAVAPLGLPAQRHYHDAAEVAAQLAPEACRVGRPAGRDLDDLRGG